MPASPRLEIRPLSPSSRDDYLELFEQRAFTDNPGWASCYCHFPHADHGAVEWSTRTGDENRAAVCARIADGRMSGWLAYVDGRPIGWCNAGPRAAVDGLLGAADPDAARIGAIACFVIAPEHRGQGVARALLAAACEGLAARGFEWAEGYPRRASDGSAADNHLGPLALFREAGFEEAGPAGSRGVRMRKRLNAPKAEGLGAGAP